MPCSTCCGKERDVLEFSLLARYASTAIRTHSLESRRDEEGRKATNHARHRAAFPFDTLPILVNISKLTVLVKIYV